tara:strand:+ start:101 stop:580 length:480 start_codon:yes stop_codon:yes gene_type:complete
MMGIKTNIRTAVENDIPHLVSLAEIHYNLHFKDGKFDPMMAEDYARFTMLDQNSVGLVIEDSTRIPFGYLSGTMSNLYLTNEIDATTHNWFVHNPKFRYGTRNYGLELLTAFEGWARHHGARSIRLGMTMMPRHKRVFDRVFKKLNYDVETVYYKKDLL